MTNTGLTTNTRKLQLAYELGLIPNLPLKEKAALAVLILNGEDTQGGFTAEFTDEVLSEEVTYFAKLVSSRGFNRAIEEYAERRGIL